MRDLSNKEINSVSGGNYADDISGLGSAIISEISAFISGLNSLGTSLGSWLYSQFGDNSGG